MMSKAVTVNVVSERAKLLASIHTFHREWSEQEAIQTARNRTFVHTAFDDSCSTVGVTNSTSLRKIWNRQNPDSVPI
jgi:hypothetical protein